MNFITTMALVLLSCCSLVQTLAMKIPADNKNFIEQVLFVYGLGIGATFLAAYL